MTVAVPDVARGYAVWLEPSHLHFHSGGKAEVRAYWGAMMQQDGQGQPENWRAFVIDPAGTELPAKIESSTELFQIVAFQTATEGLYTVVLENNAGVYCALPDGSWVRGGGSALPQGARCSRYVQWARVAAPVGHHVHGNPPGVITGGLDIIPGGHHDFAPGDKLELRVYFRGKPLPGAVLKGVSHLFNGSDVPLTGVTGQEGEAEFIFSAKGHWMFTVTYTDDTDAQEGLYHSTVHTTTLVVPGVR